MEIKFQFIAISLLLISSCTENFKVSNENPISESFESAKNSSPELIAFLQKMPKGADLHNHLDGTIFSENILKSAIDNSLNYNIKSGLFTNNNIGNNIVPVTELISTPRLYQSFREDYSVRGWQAANGVGREDFFAVFGRIGSSGHGERKMLADVVKRSQYQNIQHQELIAPVVPARVRRVFSDNLNNFDINDLDASFEQVSSLVTRPDIRNAIRAQIDGWEKYAFKQNDQTIGSEVPSLRYIAYVIRLGSLKDFFISTVTGFSAITADERIVSLTLVAPEDLPDANNYFDDHMKILNFLWGKMGQPPMTLHAGELTMQDATPESMRERIRQSINKGHAKRIGHGVSVAWERDVDGLLKEMAASKILVEICLTSNEIILGVSGKDHPFDL